MSVDTVVMVVLFLIGAALIFGLLFWAVNYCEREFPGASPFFRFARIFLVLAAVFVLIGLILDLMGHPIIVWRRV
jgi:phosphoglycerol transferase MdoB-like AlkP superfamily enzyme